MTQDATEALTRQRQALADALAALLAPLARLAVARGLPYAAVDEILKTAFVDAASAAHPGLLPHRRVSRISTVTGINRREVTRLTQAAEPARPRGRSLVSELFAHWLTDPRYLDDERAPRVLPRQGPAPSFEALAQEITRDVHPRSLLDELLRLQLATLDERRDEVRASRHAVPAGDLERLLGFLADNVGDHLRASVDNVLAGGPQGRHFEQALFADGVSDETWQWFRVALRAQWDATLAALVPELERRIEADTAAAPPATRRLRLGVYTYDEPAPAADAGAPGADR